MKGIITAHGVMRLVSHRALPRVPAELAAAPRPVLLTNLGLLARYDQMTFLDGLRDAAGHPDGPPGVWLLAEFLQVAELYTGRADFDVAKLVARLVEDESVPLLPVLRYKPSGLRKRAAWERTWALQRMEDAIDARVALPVADPDRLTSEAAATLKEAEVGAVPAPPRYAAADFRKGGWWRLRGKLDVPKERFVSLPACERDADPSLVVAWAGWNALEQSRAVAGYFSRMREQEGWTAGRQVGSQVVDAGVHAGDLRRQESGQHQGGSDDPLRVVAHPNLPSKVITPPRRDEAHARSAGPEPPDEDAGILLARGPLRGHPAVRRRPARNRTSASTASR